MGTLLEAIAKFNERTYESIVAIFVFNDKITAQVNAFQKIGETLDELYEIQTRLRWEIKGIGNYQQLLV